MAVRDWFGGGILMGLFNDTVTLYQKQAEGYKITVLEGVQWSDVVDKTIVNGKLTLTKSASITIPENKISEVDLASYTEEDAIFFGEIQEEVTDEKGSRLSDLLKAFPKSGIIRTVNDNSNRDRLKNIKVVIY